MQRKPKSLLVRLNISKAILNILYKLYKLCLSPFLGNNCRFTPSCSDYAYQAIDCHGWVKGSFLAIKRLAKCHPYSKTFGFDPVEKDFKNKNI